MNQHLIEDIFSGNSLTDRQITLLAEQISARGFDPLGLVVAGSRLKGIHWGESTLTETSIILTAEAHYLRHVVHRKEWPEGTDLAGYLQSISAVIADPTTGIFASLFRGMRQIGFVRRSSKLKGPEGGEWVLIESSVSSCYWITAFQLSDIERQLEHTRRSAVRWLRVPS